MKNIKNFIPLFISVSILIILAVIFGIYDLEISNAIAQFDSGFGLAMELSGMLIAPYLLICSGLIISAYCQKSTNIASKKLKVYFGYFCAIGGICFCIYIYMQMNLIIIAIFITLITAIFIQRFILFLKKKTSDELYEVFKIAVISITYMLLVLIFINVFKVFWGRVRFREMKNISEYTPWFLPQGINGNRSFPSGHTANATTLYIITMFFPLVKKTWQKNLCYIIPILWIIIMGASRVLVGAHYSSDVLFGAYISIGLFYIAKKLVLKRFPN